MEGINETVESPSTELTVTPKEVIPLSSAQTFESSLSESLVSAQTDNMLEFLSKKKDLRIINQQRDEPELSSEQRLDMLRSIFMASPMSFLNRFGKHLQKIHLDYFSSLTGLEKDKCVEVRMYAKALEKAMSGVSQEIVAKNRRYEALQRLVDTTDYFTEPEMQRRNPILFEQLIGRYHSKEEREAFLQLLEKYSTGKQCTPLSDMLIAHMNRSDDNVSERRLQQEDQINQEDAADEEYFEDQDMEDDGYDYGPPASGRKVNEEEETEEIDEDEKDLLKEEFFTTMYRNFLEGKDEDFDYSTVDDNEEYDCGEVLNQDAEDRYFDAEDSLSCHSDNMEGGGDSDMRSSPTLNPHGTHNEEDSEDELDIYMKSIEKQLQTRN
ncbi:unnamed protein product [Allacma fusca]|uniref:CCD97-like C-terminal domain-containing protein n=1 Tax=Allacma fusca TaxID=39272 RepID=A0A8J2PW12_9HEXA|nr:unnamed protein product [Allacma fusca]